MRAARPPIRLALVGLRFSASALAAPGRRPSWLRVGGPVGSGCAAHSAGVALGAQRSAGAAVPGSAGLRAPSSRPLRPPRAPPPSADAPSQPCAPHRTHTGARTRCARHTRSSGECEEHGAMRWSPPKNSTVVTISYSCLYAVLPRARGGRAAVAARRAAKLGRAAAQPPQPQSGRAPARRRGRTFLRGVPAAAARSSGDCEGHGNMRW